MATSTLAKGDTKAFHKLWGHYQSECLPGCVRPHANGKDGHRQSLKRPGDLAGKPFTETWADMKARKAERRAGGNGPVVVVQAATPPAAPAATPAAPTVDVSKYDATFKHFALFLNEIRSTLNVHGVLLQKLASK